MGLPITLTRKQSLVKDILEKLEKAYLKCRLGNLLAISNFHPLRILRITP